MATFQIVGVQSSSDHRLEYHKAIPQDGGFQLGSEIPRRIRGSFQHCQGHESPVLRVERDWISYFSAWKDMEGKLDWEDMARIEGLKINMLESGTGTEGHRFAPYIM